MINKSIKDLGEILMDMREGFFDESYQYEAKDMSTEDKSKIIEAIVIGMPLPPIYCIKEQSKFKVLRGQNIINAIYEFYVKKSFTLEGLKFIPEYNGRDGTKITLSERIKSSRANQLTIVLYSGPQELQEEYIKNIEMF